MHSPTIPIFCPHCGGEYDAPSNAFPNIKRKEDLFRKLDLATITNGILPGKISPTDLDGLIHIGHPGSDNSFLGIEFKQGNGDPPLGQSIALRSLANLPEWTIVIVNGALPYHVDRARAWRGGLELALPTADAFREFVATWARNCHQGRHGAIREWFLGKGLRAIP